MGRADTRRFRLRHPSGSAVLGGDEVVHRRAERTTSRPTTTTLHPSGGSQPTSASPRGQLALAWLLHQHPAVVPIPGSRTPAHIDENLAAAEVRLDEGTLARVDEASASVEAAGGTLL